ncbi:winged helix-turn-helix domain-containing protein [Roseimarinus sediminis]|uniref:winged helix-turn-helix domain-containing protein n=1 Tax=Roseimarinus sediminis TaxID=1610899 RepID=UPI003D1D60C0
MFEALDPLLHQQVRLGIVSLLMGVKSAEFKYLLEHIDTTKGNLSFQLSKLSEAGYVEIQKKFTGSYPQTHCAITEKGIEAFEKYIEALQSYLK